MYKYSYYNFLVADPQGKFYLLYNSLYNGLYEVNRKQFVILQQFEKKQVLHEEDLDCPDESFKTMLLRNQILVDNNMDEREIIRKREKRIKDGIYKKNKITLTLIPTNNCNLDCIYCFEGEKRHKGTVKKEIFDTLLKRIENEMINQNCTSLYVTWYGGEPMLGLKVINEYTPLLLELARKNNLSYGSSMITNGTLLNSKRWEDLIKNRINKVQITIDGNEMIHNVLRPHVNSCKNSYQMILNALRQVPKGIEITIRVNCNKAVVTVLPNLLQDMDKYEIWPHKAKQIRIKLAKMVNYSNSKINSVDVLSEDEFTSISEDFRYQMFLYAFNWAKEKNLPFPKFSFRYPELSSFFCATTHYPHGFAMDQYGFIYKCWNYVNNAGHRLHHINKPYREIFHNPDCMRLLNFSKLSDRECLNCKYAPICSSNCPIDRMENRKRCCEWKYNLQEHLVLQYSRYLTHPESIIFNKNQSK
jgi:uncharacterized protein